MDLKDYHRRVNASPKMDSTEAEKLLASRNGQSEEKIANAFQRLVRAVVSRWRSAAAFCGVDIGELVSAGNYGLLLAMRSFNPDRNTRFSNWAWRYVSSYVAREFYAASGTKRPKAKNRGDNNRLQIRVETFASLTADERTVDDGDSSYLDGMPNAEVMTALSFNPGPRMLAEIEVPKLLSALKRTTGGSRGQRAVAVVGMREGLSGYSSVGPMTLGEVGLKLFLSKEGVRKIRKQAMGTLREIVSRR